MVGIGHIGTGGMARVRAQAFLERQDTRLEIGCSRTEAGLAEYRKLTQARGTQDWRAVVADPRVDAVCVGTPTATHTELALAAVQAGKHVLVECPAVSDLAELDRLTQAAERARVALYIGSNYRFDRNAQAVAYAVAHLGAIRLVHGDSSWRPPDGSWFWQPVMSGGTILCVHLYQWALFHCLGRALWVEAAYADDAFYGVAQAKYAGGALGLATGGFHTHGSNAFGVVGSEGLMRQEPDGQFILRRGGASEPIAIKEVDPTVEDNACFVRCLRGEEDWRVHLAREREILALALAAQRAADTDARVVLPAGTGY